MSRPMRSEAEAEKVFWSRVNKTRSCWVWTGAVRRADYGEMWFNGKILSAPRLALMFAGVKIPDGHHVCHKCDTPRCVRPSHLFHGTPADNMADKVRKNRQTKGENNGGTKLTAAKVLRIRKLCAAGVPQSVIAKKFGVEQTNISFIKRRVTWKHV